MLSNNFVFNPLRQPVPVFTHFAQPRPPDINQRILGPPHPGPQADRPPGAVCRPLIAEPDLLLCDAPTGNLDPTTSQRVLDLLFEQVTRSSAPLLVVTHDYGLLDRFEHQFDVRELAGRSA